MRKYRLGIDNNCNYDDNMDLYLIEKFRRNDIHIDSSYLQSNIEKEYQI